MSQGRSRGKTKGVEEFRPYVTRVLPVGARIKCADNSGAKILEIVMVQKIKTTHSRLPAGAVGDFVNVVSARLASSCSRNGISEAATDTICFGDTSM